MNEDFYVDFDPSVYYLDALAVDLKYFLKIYLLLHFLKYIFDLSIYKLFLNH